MNIRIALSGRNYELAAAVPGQLDLPDGSSLDDALEHLANQLPEGQTFPGTCLLAVSGKHLGTVSSHSAATLSDGDEIVIVAPVAGG